MTYTVNINSRGTITIPKSIRKAMGTSKILIIQKGESYIFQPIKDVLSLGASLKTTKTTSDKQVKALRKKAFLRSKNTY